MNIRQTVIRDVRSHIQPTSDIFARYLLSSPKNVHLTKSFINAVLEDSGEDPVEKVQILSPFNLRESIFDKETVMDIKVSDIKGHTYDVEIQNTTSGSFWNRMTYYNNSIYNSQLGTSEKYEKLLPTTVIALLKDHIYKRDEGIQEHDKLHHYSHVVHKDDHDTPFYPCGDPEKFHILELDRFAFSEDALYNVKGSEQRKLCSGLFHWLRFFIDGADEEYMEKYNETETAVKEAKAEYERFLTDRQLADAQLRHEMWLHDQAQAKSDAEKEGREEGREEGMKEGRKEGRKEGIAETALNFKALGVAIETISKATGLSVEEINKL